MIKYAAVASKAIPTTVNSFFLFCVNAQTRLMIIYEEASHNQRLSLVISSFFLFTQKMGGGKGTTDSNQQKS